MEKDEGAPSNVRLAPQACVWHYSYVLSTTNRFVLRLRGSHFTPSDDIQPYV